MVAKFRGTKSLRQILNYNECKVTEGMAALIGEGRYGKDPGDLTFKEKLVRLTDLAQRNWRSTNTAMHISLSFSPEDQVDDRKLNVVAKDYLKYIGFGGQPYLVYRHLDTRHPHIHVVTTNITRAGKHLDVYFRCLGKSFKAARALEKKHGLEYALGVRKKEISPGTPAPVEYGKSELRRGIADVVNEVVANYRVTSLADFNLVLSQFNVMADRGSPTSEMFANGGLLYRATRDGKRIGVPVKASAIEGKPTLRMLQDLFHKNAVIRMNRKENLEKWLNNILTAQPTDGGFLYALKQREVSVSLRLSEAGTLSEVIYIDNLAGVVFNGNELGKSYGADELSRRFSDFQGVLHRLRASISGSEESSFYMSCAIRDGHYQWERLRQSQDQRLRRGLRM